jgi:NTE family protein
MGNSFSQKMFVCFFVYSFSIFAQSTILKLEFKDKILPFGLVERVPTNLPEIGLALSGGGARSISQIGVLRAFERKNIPIEYIVGTSMGSIIGGLYSAGYKLDELDSLIEKTKWEDFFSAQQSNRNELFIDQKITEDKAIVAFRMDGLNPIIPTSFSSGQRAANFLNLMVINAPIVNDDNYDLLQFKFRAVSSDLVSGRGILLNKGSLGASLRASSSVTLLLPPVKTDSSLLVDGGLVANVPARETRELGADIVVAVNTSSPLYTEQELDVPWRIADQLLSIPMNILNDQQLSSADFIISPKLEGRKNSNFNELQKIISEGYESSLETVNKIEILFEKMFKDNLQIKEKTFANLRLEDNPTELEKNIYSQIADISIVSNKQLLFLFYKSFREGYWKDGFITVDELENKAVLRVNVQENAQIEQINLTGASIIKADSILYILRNILRKPFSSRKTFESVLEVLRMYKRNGYSFARIEKVSFDSISRALDLKINEGVITKITVEGNHKTKEQIITREFPLKVGDYFKYEVAEKGLTNLRSTNLFDQIELTVIGQNGNNELKISLLEKVSAVIRLGMRIDNEYLTQFSLDVRDENFNGTGTEIGAIISGGARNRSYSIEQKANRVFDSFLAYKVRGFYEFNDVNEYRDDTTTNENRFSRKKWSEYRQIFYGGSFAVGAQVERFGNLFVEARYQRDQVDGLNNFEDSYKTDISSLKLSLIVDSQNEYPYPSKGFLIKSFYETAQKALGGDISYTKFLFDYRNYFGLRVDHVWCFRTMIGAADNTLPLSQQFSLGGQNTFFGLRENEFRGRQVFLTSLEVRYKFPFKLFFESFVRLRYDLGSIWDKREEIRFKDLKHGVGLTLSFNTPVGPADFALGKSFYFMNTLDKNKIVWGPTFFYFTIGYYY